MLHTTCAKVTHLSGAGKYIDKFDHDTQDMDMLATDSTSSEVLTHAFLGLMLQPSAATKQGCLTTNS